MSFLSISKFLQVTQCDIAEDGSLKNTVLEMPTEKSLQFRSTSLELRQH